MRRVARVGLLGFVLSSLACQQELDYSKPAADPLDDPWVNSIEDSEPAPALVASADTPAATPAATPSLEAAAAPTDAATGVLAQPVAIADSATPSASVAKSSNHPGKTAELAPSPAPGEPSPASGEPSPAGVEPTAGGEPTSEPAAIEPAPAAKAEPAAAPALTIADFAGNYRYSGGSAQRAELAQAIEDAVLQLAMPIRGIGRKRLTNTNPIDDTLAIKISGDSVQTIFESGFDAECTIDGGTVKWTSKKGDKYKVRLRKKDTKLVQVIEGEDGVKTTVFVLSADKQTLTVHHKITADRLETPMTYKLSYKRK